MGVFIISFFRYDNVTMTMFFKESYRKGMSFQKNTVKCSETNWDDAGIHVPWNCGGCWAGVKRPGQWPRQWWLSGGGMILGRSEVLH